MGDRVERDWGKRLVSALVELKGRCWPRFLASVAMFVTLAVVGLGRASAQSESTDDSLAAYADAANFQTNGALPLAIESWTDFLEDFPNDPLAPKAAHYLGVCLMQKENPDYGAAAEAFGKALQNKEYELREESLANRGWCLYASAGEAPNQDQQKLTQALKSFQQLRQEKPDSRYLDRGLFYSGEAAYGLKQPQKAIEYYDALLNLATAKDSPLRCDALYARGVAYEDVKDYEKAIGSYRQLLDQCAKGDLVTDVQLRIGDLQILRTNYSEALTALDEALKSAKNPDDAAYALFRQGFALVQAERPKEAAVAYDRLAKEYPNSKYAASATLASAQSAYRGGDLKMAEDRFQQVLKQNSGAASTEAAHWLARIALGEGQAAKALEIAKKQLAAKAEGEFAVALRLDLAEALSRNPATLPETMTAYESIYREFPKDPLAPRALYNASFSAMQTGQYERAIEWAKEFIKVFPQNPLLSDVRFVAAESHLMSNQPEQASEIYSQLIQQSDPTNVQRPLWVLRGAASLLAVQKFADARGLLDRESAAWKEPRKIAEANFMRGQLSLAERKPEQAAADFDASYKADPSWTRADEARLLAAQAKLTAGKRNDAVTQWKEIIDSDQASRMAAQARYKLAQLASTEGSFERSIQLYDEILGSKADVGLYPYALYGKSYALMQLGKHAEAVKSLDQLLTQFANHSVASDARLARGVSYRNLGRDDEAQRDLTQFLESNPRGTNLGHVLYELALVAQKRKDPKNASEYLAKLVKDVPNYPAMPKVLYEWGWLLNEAGQAEQAAEKFALLVKDHPEDELVPEAAFFIGQQDYSNNDWTKAADWFEVVIAKASDPALLEKAYYRLGWSLFRTEQYDKSKQAFEKQAAKFPEGKLSIDASMMVGETLFKSADYESAIKAYETARGQIRKNNETAQTIRDSAERQVRELVLLHGGQSAAQLKQWDVALQWYDELRQRFPSTVYLPQVFYEIGFAHQQLGDNAKALQFFTQVADNYRNDVAARARFMMGEIHFAEKRLDQAITDFQRVMFGFGADKAPDEIKNWQAKSAFEAGRCSEILIQEAKSAASRDKAKEFATTFFNYVIEKHPQHELVEKSRERLEDLKKP